MIKTIRGKCVAQRANFLEEIKYQKERRNYSIDMLGGITDIFTLRKENQKMGVLRHCVKDYVLFLYSHKSLIKHCGQRGFLATHT